MDNEKQLKVFRLDDGEDWWILAYDEEDALAIGKTMDIGIDDDFEEVTVELVAQDKPFTVTMTDGYHESEAASFPAKPYRESERGYWKVTATFAEWARAGKHGDLIASSVF